MNNLIVIAALLAVMTLAYQLGLAKSGKQASRLAREKNLQAMHSRPHHHGALVAFWATVPALLLFFIWVWLSPWVVNQLLLAELTAQVEALGAVETDALLRRISNVAEGFVAAGVLAEWEID